MGIIAANFLYKVLFTSINTKLWKYKSWQDESWVKFIAILNELPLDELLFYFIIIIYSPQTIGEIDY